MSHSPSIRNICWSAGTLFILATDGTLYHGLMVKRNVELSINRNSDEFIEQRSNGRADISDNQECTIELKRIPNIDRITNVAVDQRCESFVILQENSKRYLTIPTLADDPMTFKALLNETSEFDLLHDIVFHVSFILFIIPFNCLNIICIFRLKMKYFQRINTLSSQGPKDCVTLYSNIQINIFI